MQKRTLILSITIAIIAFIVFGFVSKEPVKVDNEIALTNSKVEYTTAKLVDVDFFPKTGTILKEEDLFYSVGGRYHHSITHEKLNSAKLMRDLIPNYPVNWIGEYDAIEMSIYSDGVETKTISKSEVLSPEQISLFNAIKMSGAIHFKIKYKTKNPVSDTYAGKIHSSEMNVSIAVVPDTPAEYVDGYVNLIDYLKSGSMDKIVGKTLEEMKFTRLEFTINTTGTIEQVSIKDSSGDSEVDAVLFNLISKMPKWRPAKNAKNELINQKFEFILTYGDNC